MKKSIEEYRGATVWKVCTMRCAPCYYVSMNVGSTDILPIRLFDTTSAKALIDMVRRNENNESPN